MNVQDIKIKDIVVTQNSRVDLKDISELMESIKQHGLMHPIHVGKAAGEKYIFESGRRRLMACDKLGWQTIPAVVSTEKKYKDLLITNLVENVNRKDLSVAELGRICCDLRDNQGMNPKELSVALSLPLSKVNTAMAIYQRVPVRFRNKISFLDKRTTVSKGKISASAANLMLSIRHSHKLKQPEFEALFETAMDQQLSINDVKSVAGLIRSGYTVAQALKERNSYKDYTIVVTANEDEVLDLAKRYKLTQNTTLMKILYGEIQETLKRPKFVTTGK